MGELKAWGGRFGRYGFLLTMALGLGLMLTASASYLELGDEHPFFLEKLPLARPKLWLGALYLHVPSALLSLPACLVLLSARVRARFPRFHRWLGRIAGSVILLAVVPTGMYLALFAQGGFISTLGFWLTGVITGFAMLQSIRFARRGEMRAHRRFSLHVVAQLSVAVVSRFALAGADMLGVYDEWVYVAALWVPVIGCALIAEVLTRPRGFSNAKGARHEDLDHGSGVYLLRGRRAR